MRWLLLAFLIIPALEIGIFVWAGGVIGPWWVVALIILTGIVGLAIAKQQGMETWQRAQLSLRHGQVPGEEILDGICILVGAIFLFTPGFLTDIVGFILVLPWSRNLFKGFFIYLFKRMINNNQITFRRW
ncbi:MULTISPECIES: FxsA family protein [unclassified Virgibacillus]|uniref:FxsA family protein n=1 Tax=unclassified Virgibacillus TaxID=2620237 RepID=UPI0024DEAC55|nr:FxsA family protein [Virgibacillus sp. LDC-1]